ncbi:MAG: porin [Gemmatimonadaceae bacterium]
MLRAVARPSTLLLASLLALPADESQAQARIGPVDTTGPAIHWDGQGLRLRSPENDRQLRLRNVIQMDMPRLWIGDDQPGISSFAIRRARMTMDIVLHPRVSMRLMPEFSANGVVDLEDGFADVSFSRATWLRVGRFRSPYGQERATLIIDQYFPERSIASSLTSNRDQGLQLTHEINRGELELMGGVFNGVPDNASAFADANTDKDLAARVIWRPRRRTVRGSAQGLVLGSSATRGRQSPRGTDLQTPAFRTPTGTTWFTYRTGVGGTAADGWRERAGGFVQLHEGRLSLNGEVLTNRAMLRRGTAAARVQTSSWLGLAAWSLTDHPASQVGLTPSRNGSAWQVLARVAGVRVGDAAFPTFADPAAAPQRATELALGLNWYLQRQTKVQMAFERIQFDGGAPGGASRPTERYATARLQVMF